MSIEEFLNGLTEEETVIAQQLLEQHPDISVHVLAIMLNSNRKPAP